MANELSAHPIYFFLFPTRTKYDLPNFVDHSPWPPLLETNLLKQSRRRLPTHSLPTPDGVVGIWRSARSGGNITKMMNYLALFNSFNIRSRANGTIGSWYRSRRHPERFDVPKSTRQVKNASKATDREASRVKQQVAKVSNAEIYNIRRIAHLQEMQRSHLCRMFLQLRK